MSSPLTLVPIPPFVHPIVLQQIPPRPESVHRHGSQPAPILMIVGSRPHTQFPAQRTGYRNTRTTQIKTPHSFSPSLQTYRTMSSRSVHAEPVSPNGGGHYIISNPPSSTPTIDVSFDRSGLGDFTTQSMPPPPLWPHRLSASFSAMADQIAATSQALALVPSTAFSGSDVGGELGALKGRLEGIERTQERIMAEFEALKRRGMTGGTDPGNVHVNGNENGITTVEGEGEGEDKPAIPDAAAQAAKIEELEKKLNELSETVKIE